MDRNKAKKVVEVGLSIGMCCGTCANFSGGNRRGFGTCAIHTYFHLKHQEERHLSVHETHFCDEEWWACDEEETAPANYLLEAQRVSHE